MDANRMILDMCMIERMEYIMGAIYLLMLFSSCGDLCGDDLKL